MRKSASTMVAPVAAPRGVLGANDRIGVGLIGCGERGRGVAAHLEPLRNLEVVAVSDAYGPRRDQAVAEVCPKARAWSDYREVLDDRDVDAVVIATPDHWHAPMTVQAIQAGKDVYVEKPVTHNLEEGEQLLAVAEGSEQVIATGTQQRSWDHFLEAKGLVEKGVLGRVTFVRCHWLQNHLTQGWRRVPDVDRHRLDWEQWLGPAPKQPFSKVRFHYWRFFWDFGGGSVTDLMTHWIDVIQWFMNSAHADEVHAVGSTYVQDWLEVPDTVTATMLFPEGYTAAFEGSLIFGLQGAGIVFRGDKAMMTLDRNGYALYEEGAMPFEAPGLPAPVHCFERPEPKSNAERMDGSGTLANLRNWIGCICDRSTPNAHLRAAVDSANTAHRVNDALRTKRILEESQI